jgi:hypothetical protein
MEQLQHLKQKTTVDHYINNYETWMTMMKRGRNYLPQEFFVDRFISGLKDNIKHTVQCQKPDTLLSAYWYARLYEKSPIVHGTPASSAPTTKSSPSTSPPSS